MGDGYGYGVLLVAGGGGKVLIIIMMIPISSGCRVVRYVP